MPVSAEHRSAFSANRPIAERGPFRGMATIPMCLGMCNSSQEFRERVCRLSERGRKPFAPVPPMPVDKRALGDALRGQRTRRPADVDALRQTGPAGACGGRLGRGRVKRILPATSWLSSAAVRRRARSTRTRSRPLTRACASCFPPRPADLTGSVRTEFGTPGSPPIEATRVSWKFSCFLKKVLDMFFRAGLVPTAALRKRSARAYQRDF